MNYEDFQYFFNKILVFYKPELSNYWTSITPFCTDSKPEQLGRYYLDYTSKAEYPGRFENGIPLFQYPGEQELKHPTIVTQYACGLWELYYKSNYSDASLRDKFMRQADWLVNNAEDLNGSKYWDLGVTLEPYKLKPPWISALTQGQGISVLTRAFKITGKEIYLSTAEKALIPFNKNVKDGGLAAYYKDCVIYEEYPSLDRTNAVLNGFIFSLFGIYDLYLTNRNSNAKDLFDTGINSLKVLLPYYDLGFWVRYYLYDYPKKYYASFTYVKLMADQLKVLHVLTGEKYLNDFAELWESYTKSFTKKTRALIGKILYAHWG